MLNNLNKNEILNFDEDLVYLLYFISNQYVYLKKLHEKNSKHGIHCIHDLL